MGTAKVSTVVTKKPVDRAYLKKRPHLRWRSTTLWRTIAASEAVSEPGEARREPALAPGGHVMRASAAVTAHVEADYEEGGSRRGRRPYVERLTPRSARSARARSR